MRIDVPLGAERFTVGPDDLVRTTDQGLWAFSVSFDGQVEILLAGGASGPDPPWLDLAERVVPHFTQLVAVSRFYLRTFVDERKPDGPGEWDLSWAEFGRYPDEKPEPLELVFVHDGDGYGGWGVRFFHGPAGFRPYQFRRFQQ